jgi:hypothetical protein
MNVQTLILLAFAGHAQAEIQTHNHKNKEKLVW